LPMGPIHFPKFLLSGHVSSRFLITFLLFSLHFYNDFCLRIYFNRLYLCLAGRENGVTVVLKIVDYSVIDYAIFFQSIILFSFFSLFFQLSFYPLA